MKTIVHFSATQTQYTWRCDHCNKQFDKIKITDYEALTGPEKMLRANAMLQVAEEHTCGA